MFLPSITSGAVMTERLERAAITGFFAYQHDVPPESQQRWEDVRESTRVTFRMVADAILMMDAEHMFQPQDDNQSLCRICNQTLGKLQHIAPPVEQP